MEQYEGNCMKYSASYSATSTSYIQCRYWGGDSGGLNAWYACGGIGDYSNVSPPVQPHGLHDLIG